MRYTNSFLYAVSTNLEQDHIVGTFAQKFVCRLCINIFVDRFGALAVNSDTYKKANWIGYILPRNCLLKHVTEGNIDETGRGERRHKQLLVTLSKREGTGILRRKQFVLSGEFALEEAMDLSRDRL